MGKIFSSSEYVVEMVEKTFEESGLASYGFTLEVMSVTKSKQPIKVSKANPVTEHLVNASDVICVEIYEKAFERLSEDYQKKLVEMYISGISYDSEKDKLTIQNREVRNLFNMCKKYGNGFVSILEASYLAIDQIEEEEKEEKERLKAEKAAAKKSRKQF